MTSANNVAEWLETAQFLCQLAVALNVVGMSVCVAADLLRSRDVGWTGSRILIISGRCRISRAVAKFFLLPTDSGVPRPLAVRVNPDVVHPNVAHSKERRGIEKHVAYLKKGGNVLPGKDAFPTPGYATTYRFSYVFIFFLSNNTH